MEGSLSLSDIADALGAHDSLPTPEEFQRLIAAIEVSIFVRRPAIEDATLATAWYLHGVASASAAQQLYSLVRQRRAFAVSAQVFDLALEDHRWSRAEELEIAFAACVAYRRCELDPNATAIYRRVAHNLSEGPLLQHVTTLSVEAGVAFLGLDTRRGFTLSSLWLRQLEALATQVGLNDLQSTAFGPASAVVRGVWDLLRYLSFGDPDRLASARAGLTAVALGQTGIGDLNARWVAAHLLAFGEALETDSLWALPSSQLPPSGKQAFTLAAPPVLTLWPPQRDLLFAQPSPLEPETRRIVVSVPTSAGKSLIGQILSVGHLASAGSSVCYVAPLRSLGREVRRSLGMRLRVLQKEVGGDLPDYGGWSVGGFEAQESPEGFPEMEGAPPDVEVMTPERLGHLLRRDSNSVLDRYGLFIFDEAQLLSESGRGFGIESVLAFLNWRTRNTHHRIVLLSATMGNAGQVMTWLQTDSPGQLQESAWRGPRRLHAVFTTTVDWTTESRTAGHRGLHPVRLNYPLIGTIRLRVADQPEPVQLRLTEPVGQLVLRAHADGATDGKDQGHSTPNYQAVAQLVTALGHAGSVLVIVSTRAAARSMAEQIAAHLEDLPAARPVADFARTQLGEDHPLIATLLRGVAFHHAALPSDVLEAIEDAVREDRIPYLVSTSTLAEGVNLPVRTVVISETEYEGMDPGAKLSGPRLVNAMGRAGRAGKESEGWIVLAHFGASTSGDGFEKFTPNSDDMEVRSRLVSEEALADLAAFEERLSAREDAIFSAGGPVADFIGFVWFVLAAEEILGVLPDDCDIDAAVQATLAYSQMDDDARAAWRQAAEVVRAAYASADPARRRSWARVGTSIGSAREVDRLAFEVFEAVQAQNEEDSDDPSALGATIGLFDRLGTFGQLLRLPECPREWRFRSSPRGGQIAVSFEVVRDRWLSGQPMSLMAADLLQSVSDPSWRIEQLVDLITDDFEHYLSWTVGALVEIVNARLSEAGSTRRLCASLGAFFRYGVGSEISLALMLSGIRSRRLAQSVAEQADPVLALPEIRAWLHGMSLPEWRARFEASPAELLDLLDFARVRRRSLLRVLLESGQAELALDDWSQPASAWQETGEDAAPTDTELIEITAYLEEILADPSPRRLAAFTVEGQLLGTVPLIAHTDMRSLLDTGLALTCVYSPTTKALTLQLSPESM